MTNNEYRIANSEVKAKQREGRITNREVGAEQFVPVE